MHVVTPEMVTERLDHSITSFIVDKIYGLCEHLGGTGPYLSHSTKNNVSQSAKFTELSTITMKLVRKSPNLTSAKIWTKRVFRHICLTTAASRKSKGLATDFRVKFKMPVSILQNRELARRTTTKMLI